MRNLFVILMIAILLTPVFAAETTNEESKVGEKYDQYIRQQIGVYPDENIQKYVASVGRKLAAGIEDPDFQFHFTVLDDPTINAFAVPGGYVYVYRGLLAYLDSEAALAGILGHEMGHVVGHHAYKQMKKSMGDTLLILAGLGASVASGGGGTQAAAWVTASATLSQLNSAGYGRELENQADEFGLIYASEAGYDPREQAKFFRMLQFKERVSGVGYHGFLASHPETMERIIKVKEKADILENRKQATEVDRDRYIEKMEGVAFGAGDRHLKVPAPYVLKGYRTVEGDTFRIIAKTISGDEGLAFEVAVMNAMLEYDPIPVGKFLKVPVPRPPQQEKKIGAGETKQAK